MGSITMDGLTKVYPNGYQAVQGVSLQVEDGELMVLVGPSGCGKTTVLRMVAGLEQISEGTLSIAGRIVNGIGPEGRDIAMVFQNYALYPHMNVARNIGFSLSLRGEKKTSRNAKVHQAADILGLAPWLDRKPGELSGGQRQRVAMGRAIVREPTAFLMDEPLSNLDAKLRVQMRAEVIRLHRRLGVATIYVTHDQTEAMTMGNRVAVMRAGKVEQVGAPGRLYEDPSNVFVATFIGSPSVNLFEAHVSADGRGLVVGAEDFLLPASVLAARPALSRYAGRAVLLGLRPEHLALAASDATAPGIRGTVDLVESLGSESLIYFAPEARRVLAPDAPEEEELDLEANAVARVDPRAATGLHGGTDVHFSVDLVRALFFDAESGRSIRER